MKQDSHGQALLAYGNQTDLSFHAQHQENNVVDKLQRYTRSLLSWRAQPCSFLKTGGLPRSGTSLRNSTFGTPWTGIPRVKHGR